MVLAGLRRQMCLEHKITGVDVELLLGRKRQRIIGAGREIDGSDKDSALRSPAKRVAIKYLSCGACEDVQAVRHAKAEIDHLAARASTESDRLEKLDAVGCTWRR